MRDYYIARVKNALMVRLQYPGNLFVWAFAGVIQPLILLTVWSTVANGLGGSVGGFRLGDFAAYFIVVLLVDTVTSTWVIWEFEYRIRGGSFSPLLLRPVHPIHGDVAENVSFKLLNLAALVPICGVLILLFPPEWNMGLTNVMLFVPAVILAAFLRFIAEWTLAMAAFWLVRVSAINQLYHASTLLLSGQIAPLILFPKAIQVLAYILPFRYYVAFPVELFLGHLSGRDVVLGFAAQVIWVVVAYILFRTIWRISMRRYSAVGA